MILLKTGCALLALSLFTFCSGPRRLNEDAATRSMGGLWAYYPVHGNVNDESGNNHVLRLRGASLTTDRQGAAGEAIDFNGAAYGIIPDGADFQANNFSVSFFVMTRRSQGLFFGKQDYRTAHGASFNIGIDPVLYGAKTRFSVTLNQNTICSDEPRGGLLADYSHPFKSGEWHHVAATFSQGKMLLYIDGKLRGQRKIKYNEVTFCRQAQFVLGDWWSGGRNALDGKLDEIRIYTRLVSAREILFLAQKR